MPCHDQARRRTVIRWRWLAWVLTVVLGATWSAGLLLAGFWMWRSRGEALLVTPTAALMPLAAGWFVWMYLVADELCPRASPAVTGFLKLVVGMVFWGAVGLTAVELVR
jgi:hypothetical protein